MRNHQILWQLLLEIKNSLFLNRKDQIVLTKGFLNCTTCLVEFLYLHSYIISFVRYGVVE